MSKEIPDIPRKHTVNLWDLLLHVTLCHEMEERHPNEVLRLKGALRALGESAPYNMTELTLTAVPGEGWEFRVFAYKPYDMEIGVQPKDFVIMVHQDIRKGVSITQLPSRQEA